MVPVADVTGVFGDSDRCLNFPGKHSEEFPREGKTPCSDSGQQSVYKGLDMNARGIEEFHIGPGVAQQQGKLRAGEDDGFDAVSVFHALRNPENFSPGLRKELVLEQFSDVAPVYQLALRFGWGN